LLGIVALLVLLLSPRWWPPLDRRIHLLYLQHQCLNYDAADDVIVYQSTATRTAIAKALPAWIQFYALLSPPGTNSAVTVFVHRLKNTAGDERLAVCEFGPDRLYIRSIRPGGLFHDPVNDWAAYSDWATFPGPATIHAGQLDPNDPSHFQVRVDGRPDACTVDGWLTPAGVMRLEITPDPTPPAPPSTASSR
jgi:hypothetical protein